MVDNAVLRFTIQQKINSKPDTLKKTKLDNQPSIQASRETWQHHFLIWICPIEFSSVSSPSGKNLGLLVGRKRCMVVMDRRLHWIVWWWGWALQETGRSRNSQLYLLQSAQRNILFGLLLGNMCCQLRRRSPQTPHQENQCLQWKWNKLHISTNW